MKNKYLRELERQINLAEDNKRTNTVRKRFLNKNNWDNRFSKFYILALFIYYIPLFIMSFRGNPISLVDFITLITLSISSGSFLQRKTDKNERKTTLSFTSASTNREIFEDEIEYAIECEKCHNRITALNCIKRKLSQNNPIIKYIDIKSNNELENRMKGIRQAMEKEFAQLDILSAKRILSERFKNVRNKSLSILKTLIDLFLGASVSSLFVLPMTFLEITFPPLVLVITFILCTISYLSLALKIKKDKKTVFEHFNESLEEQLPKDIKLDSFERREIEDQLRRTFTEIEDLTLDYIATEETLETLSSSEVGDTLMTTKDMAVTPSIEETFKTDAHEKPFLLQPKSDEGSKK